MSSLDRQVNDPEVGIWILVRLNSGYAVGQSEMDNTQQNKIK